MDNRQIATEVIEALGGPRKCEECCPLCNPPSSNGS